MTSPKFVRGLLFCAGALSMLGGCGSFGDPGPTKPNRLWCTVKTPHCLQYDTFSNCTRVTINGSMVPIVGDPVVTRENGTPICTDLDGSDQSALLDACRGACFLEASEGFPLARDPRFCTVTFNDSDTHVDKDGHPTHFQPNKCQDGVTSTSAQLIALPGVPTGSDLSSRMAGSGSFTVDGNTTNVASTTAYVSLKSPDFTCATAPCKVRVNQLSVTFQSFPMMGSTIDLMQVDLVKPEDSATAGPVGGSSQVVFFVPVGAPVLATGLVDGTATANQLAVDQNLASTYDSATGIISLHLSFAGTIRGKAVSGTAFITTSIPENKMPVANAGPDIVVNAGATCQATVTLNASASTDPDNNLAEFDWFTPVGVLGIGQQIQSTFGIGSTVVTMQAVDTFGGSAQDTVSVKVSDTTGPIVTAPAAVPLTNCPNPGIGQATATDNCSSASMPTSNAPAVFHVGPNTVTWTSSDTAGNLGQAVQSVTVNDTTPPTIDPATVPPTVNVAACGPVNLGTAPKAADQCAGTVTVTNNGPASYGPGTTTVTWTAKDASGNKATATQLVKVTDTTPPTFTFVPAAVTISKCTGANIGVATATDSCGVTITNNAPAKFPLGVTTVTWTATDGAGNVRTASQKVTAVLGDDISCCPAGTHIIVGTSASDQIVGTSGSDCILGLGGDDVIDARDGNDYVSGGAGRDTIFGGNGNDQIFGGDGDDTINAAPGNNFINGGAGTDSCFVDPSFDTATGCNP
jgi:hypothetical protein